MAKMAKGVHLVAGVGLGILLSLAALTPVAAGQKKIEASLATVNSPDFFMTRAWEVLAERVNKRTNGGLKINIVAGGALGGQKENFEAIRAGNLEMAQTNNVNLSGIYRRLALFDLPFIFRDVEHMKSVVRGPIGQQLNSEFEKQTGMKMLLFGLPDGPRSVWNRRRPIRTPDDMRGLKIRVMETPLMMDSFAAMGAIPTPMAYTELYMAARQGVIDGAETPPFAVKDNRAPEVAKYYSLTKHFCPPAGVAVGAKWFEALPAEYQKILLEEAAAARVWYDDRYAAVTEAALKELPQLGMEVNDVTDIGPFRKAVQGVYDKYADQVGGRKLIQTVIETK